MKSTSTAVNSEKKIQSSLAYLSRNSIAKLNVLSQESFAKGHLYIYVFLAMKIYMYLSLSHTLVHTHTHTHTYTHTHGS